MVARAIARKLKIATVVNAPYVAGNDIEHPNHLLINGEKVIRVNVVGFLKSKYENPEANYTSFVIEDEGKELRVKFFEFIDLEDFKEGDLLKVIGKIREQGDERFILGEIVKKVPKSYLEIRKSELFTDQTEFDQKVKKEEGEEFIVEDLGDIED